MAQRGPGPTRGTAGTAANIRPDVGQVTVRLGRGASLTELADFLVGVARPQRRVMIHSS